MLRGPRHANTSYRLEGSGQGIENLFHQGKEPLAPMPSARSLRPGAFRLELHTDGGELVNELLDALVIPRLAVVGERLELYFDLPGPPGRGGLN